ncbi:MAG: class I poly(R)-hydroxyalkanoic acid synthase [Pseudomonadota bacterium]|nr:class I poly(R)-hydroxyalkanoic acid synthase [Pseudomonadota bacterium]MEC8583450.1 class I poly(R)-hydroxyalkanoic acid synthase [Pseudomonadota bacterium]
MASSDSHIPPLPDPTELSKAVTEIAEQSQRIVTQFIERQQDGETTDTTMDPMNVAGAFLELTQRMLTDPTAIAQAQMQLWQNYLTLWQATTTRMMGGEAEAAVTAEPGDRRFKDEAWNDNPVFDYIKQSYLMTARWITETVAEVDGLDPQTAKKVDFYTRQFVDALSPSNFVATNPQVLRETVESGGQNLVNGLKNMLDDLERGDGKLKIRMTDNNAFEVGENIATAPGKVVFQNDLMQLLQFDPATETVQRRPLLIIPPWINKYYILDLQPRNSFIRWASAQGLTVFVVSWVNPDADLAEKSFADYMREGPLAALDAIAAATGEREVNAIGYCIGGTLLATTLAHMAARGDDRIASATFFTSLVDFSEAGDLQVFIDEEQLTNLERKMDRDGYLDGSDMSTTFNMLRANDLIWSFVINNYLMGRDPFPFDLLYWNSDSTRLPAAMHRYYLRNMYQHNLLVEPGALEIDAVPIDLGKITQPTFILSTKEDHIAPWAATYAATQIYGGPVKFCLAGSGHIAGVINPPADKPKYGYWTKTGKAPKSPDAWLAGATEHAGSWWPEWLKWVSRHSGGEAPARMPGDGGLPALEAAPGSYVKNRLK